MFTTILPAHTDQDNQPPTKLVKELIPGDHLVTNSGIRTVTYTQPMPGSADVLVVLDDASTWTHHGEQPWQLATEDQIAAAAEEKQRLGMAKGLAHLAGMLHGHRVAPAIYSMRIAFCVRTLADLETWAEMLDRPIRRGGTDGTIACIDADPLVTYADVDFNLHVQAQEDYPAEPAAHADTAGAR